MLEKLETLEEKLDPKHAVLLVIDVQNDFIHNERAGSKAGNIVTPAQEMVPRLISFIEEARRVGLPIIYTQATHSRWTDTPSWRQRSSPSREDHCRPNTWGWDFYQVKPREDELIIIKPRYSAFIGTHLEMTLRALGARSLIMTGVSTEGCVEATARHGYMLDCYIVVVEDCTAGHSHESHRAALDRMGALSSFVIASSQEVVQAWQKITAQRLIS